jgi:hypothetical protein
MHSTIQQYFKGIQCLSHFLSNDAAWTIDVVQHFVTHTMIPIWQQMQSQGYKYDSSSASRLPFDKIINLQAALAAATLTEKNLKRVRDIAHDEMSPTHAFHANLTTNNDNAHMSNAESTMQKFVSEGPGTGPSGTGP